MGPAIRAIIEEEGAGHNLWGEALDAATALARSAADGMSQISEQIHAFCTDDFLVRPRRRFWLEGSDETATYCLMARTRGSRQQKHVRHERCATRWLPSERRSSTVRDGRASLPAWASLSGAPPPTRSPGARPCAANCAVFSPTPPGARCLPSSAQRSLSASPRSSKPSTGWVRPAGDTLINQVIAGMLIREVAPLVVGLLLAGRNGTMTLIEISEIRGSSRFHLLEASGIGPLLLLVLPRVVDFAIAAPTLTVLFVAIALTSSWTMDVVFSASPLVLSLLPR